MNQFEQRVRELAYQIWESEGKPAGHEYRHWEMALKLAEMQGDATDEKAAGNGSGSIAPEKPESFVPGSATDTVSLQPEQSTSSMRPDISPRINEPAELTSAIRGSVHLSQDQGLDQDQDQTLQGNRKNVKKEKPVKALVTEDQVIPTNASKLGHQEKSKKNKGAE